MSLTTNSRPIVFDQLVSLVAGLEPSRRTIVAVAGAPGSGKSTLAERLVAELNSQAAGSAALLPMDGYHYDDVVLNARGLRPRKGSPNTFDVGGLFHTLERLRRNDEDEAAVPVFDRDLEISRAAARIIPRAVRHLIVEGNWLLLDEAPWSQLAPMFDATVAIDVSEETLRQRLIERWRGYKLTPAQIETKINDNDLPNARTVVARSRPADYVVRT